MGTRKDPLRLATEVGVYVVTYIASLLVCGVLMRWLAGDFFGVTTAGLLAALFANWLVLRIYAHRRLADIGLWWSRASADNLGYGLLGGAGAACLVLGPAMLTGAARLTHIPGDQSSVDTVVFVTALLAVGSAGEEIFFRGYAFQALLRYFGPAATIAPVGVAFGLLHMWNPNATWLGIANTAAFGVVFGFAYLRSRDLWLPVGLHFGWNFTLPLFGVNVSGLKMNVTGYEMSWTAGNLWSGGEYGPEASLLTSAVVILLFVYVYQAPIRRQSSPLTDPPAESMICEPSLPSPS